MLAEPLEVLVDITRDQIERLIDEPETELVLYYPDGTRVVIRISETDLEQNLTVH